MTVFECTQSRPRFGIKGTKKMKRIYIVFALLFACSAMHADTAVIDGVEWTYIRQLREGLSVGDITIYPNRIEGSTAVPKSTAGEIQVPAAIDGCPVLSVGMGAFFECKKLTSITIPKGVTNVMGWAFMRCTGLKSLSVPDGVKFIGRAAFLECKSLTDVTIPEGVPAIDHDTFMSCSSLKSVKIPESVTWIGAYAFGKCGSLAKVAIPSSVKIIGDGAFSECGSLVKVVMPASVEYIGYGAFRDCGSLKGVKFKGDAPKLGKNVFKSVSPAFKVYLPAGNATYKVVDGKWHGAKVKYYDREQ